MLSLLLKINEEADVKSSHGTKELDSVLVSSIQRHMQKLEARTNEISSELKRMDEEDRKKITSDSLREGWNSSVRRAN